MIVNPQAKGLSYENLQELSDDDFRLACGVKCEIFNAMLETLEAAEESKLKDGCIPHLSLPDQLLVMLLYHYDHWTQLQLSVDTGLNESAISRLIRQVGKRVIADERFHLPKRSERVQRSSETTPAAVVDASEPPTEQPKKTEKFLQRQAD